MPHLPAVQAHTGEKMVDGKYMWDAEYTAVSHPPSVRMALRYKIGEDGGT
jgi:hypothetical protein